MLLIDGDEIAYRCAAVTDRTFYEVGTEVFRYMEEAREFLSGEGVTDKEEQNSLITRLKETEPFYHCQHNIDSMMNRVLDDCEDIGDEFEVYLTGRDNYRKKIAKTRPYKGNRKNTVPPAHLQEAREYMKKKWGAMQVDGIEADDMMGIRQVELDTSIICSSDKDMNMIPGLHYNISKGEMYVMNEEDAIRVFYRQLLIGDGVDNIQGLIGVGEKTADKILKGLVTEEELLDAVLKKYRAVHKEHAEEMITEMGQLLWIQQKSGELWTLPAE